MKIQILAINMNSTNHHFQVLVVIMNSNSVYLSFFLEVPLSHMVWAVRPGVMISNLLGYFRSDTNRLLSGPLYHLEFCSSPHTSGIPVSPHLYLPPTLLKSIQQWVLQGCCLLLFPLRTGEKDDNMKQLNANYMLLYLHWPQQMPSSRVQEEWKITQVTEANSLILYVSAVSAAI